MIHPYSLVGVSGDGVMFRDRATGKHYTLASTQDHPIKVLKCDKFVPLHNKCMVTDLFLLESRSLFNNSSSSYHSDTKDLVAENFV